MTALLNEYRKEKFWREYIAIHVWHTARAAVEARGYELNTPSYTEIMHPDAKPEKLTTEQITGNLLSKLKG